LEYSPCSATKKTGEETSKIEELIFSAGLNPEKEINRRKNAENGT
jgi:hypothetical protein